METERQTGKEVGRLAGRQEDRQIDKNVDNKVDSMKIGRKSQTKTIRCADVVRNNHKKQADDIIYYPLMFSCFPVG